MGQLAYARERSQLTLNIHSENQIVATAQILVFSAIRMLQVVDKSKLVRESMKRQLQREIEIQGHLKYSLSFSHILAHMEPTIAQPFCNHPLFRHFSAYYASTAACLYLQSFRGSLITIFQYTIACFESNLLAKSFLR